MRDKYIVWCHVNGVIWFPVIYRNRIEFTFKTAVTLAEDYAEKNHCVCKVLPADAEFVE